MIVLCLFSDFIFLFIFLFHIHRYILNECYNCTSSIRTGTIYNSDLSFLAFLSYSVVWWTTIWWTLCIFSDFLGQFLCLIYTWYRLHVYYNWMDLFDLDRRSMPCDWTDNKHIFVSYCVIKDNILINFMYIFRFVY